MVTYGVKTQKITISVKEWGHFRPRKDYNLYDKMINEIIESVTTTGYAWQHVC